ncbi:hypothetical protein SRRS_06070 [Sporomusa rhizae]|uniref:hypothetical protein n=1 Tax=Sporomusa rhizae TaxID=357999 RepID=UPI00352B809E
MAHRIGIIGPTQSVERILAVAQNFDHGIQFIPFTFEDENEIIPILQENQAKVKGWLFSGPVTYVIAKKFLASDDNLAYCQPTGAGFYMSCLQVAFDNKVIFQRLSVDIFESLMDIERYLEETGIPWHDVYIKYYNSRYNPEDIIDFHRRLWQEGKIDGAITALRTVFHALQKQGVPVYVLTLTEQEIYQSLKIITEKVKASYFKNTQVGLVIIEIGQYDEIIEKAKTPYILQELELKLKGVLLPLCKELDGYLLDKGNGVYEIFSSRGAVEQEINMLQDTIQQLDIAIDFDVPVTAGIGYGETVFAAEINAHRALRNSRGKAGGGIVIVQDDGIIIEAVNQENELSYSYYSNDAELLEKLHRAAVGIKTYKKIETTIRRMGWDTFTVAQLAGQLSVTQQNIRRVITGLCDAGLVKYVGEEFATAKGRPGKLYRLIL